MKILAGLVLSIITSLLIAFGLEAVIETFIDQDHPYWIYFIMAAIMHYFAALSRGE